MTNYTPMQDACAAWRNRRDAERKAEKQRQRQLREREVEALERIADAVERRGHPRTGAR